MRYGLTLCVFPSDTVNAATRVQLLVFACTFVVHFEYIYHIYVISYICYMWRGVMLFLTSSSHHRSSFTKNTKPVSGYRYRPDVPTDISFNTHAEE